MKITNGDAWKLDGRPHTLLHKTPLYNAKKRLPRMTSLFCNMSLTTKLPNLFIYLFFSVKKPITMARSCNDSHLDVKEVTFSKGEGVILKYMKTCRNSLPSI